MKGHWVEKGRLTWVDKVLKIQEKSPEEKLLIAKKEADKVRYNEIYNLKNERRVFYN